MGLDQNRPQGRIHVLDHLVLDYLSDMVAMGPVKLPIYLRVDSNKMLDLGRELLGLEPIQIPGLDSGDKTPRLPGPGQFVGPLHLHEDLQGLDTGRLVPNSDQHLRFLDLDPGPCGKESLPELEERLELLGC